MIVAPAMSTLPVRATSSHSISSSPKVDYATVQATADVASGNVIEAEPPPSSVPKHSLAFYLGFNNGDHSQEEVKRVVTEGGRVVSQSQGLPEGHYDFSRMTQTEMNVALNEMIVNRRVPQSVMDGLSIMALTMPDTPTDLIQQAKDSIEFEISVDHTASANLLKAALSYMQAEHDLYSKKSPIEEAEASISYQRMMNRR